jgi:hypothetical protein
LINCCGSGCEYDLGVPKKPGARRPRGAIRRRGNSLQVIVCAGIDPLTGRRLYLRE